LDAVALAEVEENSGRRWPKHDRGHVESVATDVNPVFGDAQRAGDEVSPAREIELMAERRISALASGEGGTDGGRVIGHSVALGAEFPDVAASRRRDTGPRR